MTLVSHGQAFLVPVALAGLVAFILTPISKGLERVGIHRVIAVALLVVVTLVASGCGSAS